MASGFNHRKLELGDGTHIILFKGSGYEVVADYNVDTKTLKTNSSYGRGKEPGLRPSGAASGSESPIIRELAQVAEVATEHLEITEANVLTREEQQKYTRFIKGKMNLDDF